MTWPNWVDLVVVFLSLKACYSGYQRGVLAEVFSALGILSASALACNFQPFVSQLLSPWWRWNPAALQFTVFLAFFIAGLFVFVRIAAHQLTRLIVRKQPSGILQVLGALVGLARGLWIAGMLALIGLAIGAPYLTHSIGERSLTAPVLSARTRETLDAVRFWYPGDRLSGPAVPVMAFAPPAPQRRGARTSHGTHS